ncbi:MAG: hypothetical protein JWN17_3235, partial [Frankiales bacterium]|nr:hypothetical protein [Frankiales bacterium]
GAAALLLVSCGGAAPTAPAPPVPAPAADDLWVSAQGDDSSDGSRARPLREIDRAAQLALPGTTVHVARGRYGPVHSGRGGLAQAPVTFVSEPARAAVVDAGGAVTAWTISAAWVVVRGFDVTGALYNGVLTTASHGRVEGNRIHDLSGPSCERGGAGIVVESYVAVDNVTSGNVVELVRVRGECARVHGIYYQSPDGGVIRDNLVVATSGWGIHLWHNARGIRIENNTVVGNEQGGIAVGGSLVGNDEPPGRATGVLVANNIVVGNGGPGIGEIGRTGANSYVDNLTDDNARGGYLLADGSDPARRVEADPHFVDAVHGDYRLRGDSPARDAGTETARAEGDLDLGGRLRRQGDAVDIGAYEHAP